MSFLVSLAILLSGCGPGEDAPKKIDVTAQVTALKGNTDSKTQALSELASGGKNSKAAINDIIPLLKDEDPLVRRLAAYALGQIGPDAKAALPGLNAMMAETDISSVTAAVNAIKAIDPTGSKDLTVTNVMPN